LKAVGNFTHVYDYLEEYDKSMDLATFAISNQPYNQQKDMNKSLSMRTFGSARNAPFPSMSEACSALFISICTFNFGLYINLFS
jgi:hypothetical protein